MSDKKLFRVHCHHCGHEYTVRITMEYARKSFPSLCAVCGHGDLSMNLVEEEESGHTEVIDGLLDGSCDF